MSEQNDGYDQVLPDPGRLRITWRRGVLAQWRMDLEVGEGFAWPPVGAVPQGPTALRPLSADPTFSEFRAHSLGRLSELLGADVRDLVEAEYADTSGGPLEHRGVVFGCYPA